MRQRRQVEPATGVRRSGVIVAIALGVLLSAGCGQSPIATPTPDATSETPTPTPSAGAAPAPPEPVIDLTCSDLATPALSGLLPDANRQELEPGNPLPGREITPTGMFSVRSAGGLVCVWTARDSPWDDERRPAVSVGILPAAASLYETWAAGPGNYDNPCGFNFGSCWSTALVGDYWVLTEAFETPMDTFDAFAAEVLEVVGGADRRQITPQTTSPLASLDCDGVAPASLVASAVGVDPVLRTDPRPDMWTLWDGADDEVGSLLCVWKIDDTDSYFGHLRTLPAGRWAWDEVRGLLNTPSTPSALPIDGLGATDEAWIRCREPFDEWDFEQCVVDLIVGNDWIEFELNNRFSMYEVPYDLRAGMTALATEIVARHV